MQLDPDTIDYAMNEACGSFAYALSQLYPGGSIYILSSKEAGAEPWSADIDYEVTHVFYALDDLESQPMDAKGQRTVEEMANDFHLRRYEVVGPFDPEDFKEEFMGESDECPLYFDEQLVDSLLSR